MAKYLDTSRKKCSCAIYKLSSLKLRRYDQCEIKKCLIPIGKPYHTKYFSELCKLYYSAGSDSGGGATSPPPPPEGEKEREEWTASDPVETVLISLFFNILRQSL